MLSTLEAAAAVVSYFSFYKSCLSLSEILYSWLPGVFALIFSLVVPGMHMVARELFIVFTATCCFIVSIASSMFTCMHICVLMIVLLPKPYSQYDTPDTGVLAGVTSGTFLSPLFVTPFWCYILCWELISYPAVVQMKLLFNVEFGIPVPQLHV
jgi:hypothetical protein